MLWHSFETDKKNINFFFLTALALLTISLCYIDWIAVFLVGLMALWAIKKSVTSGKYLTVAVIALLSIVTGIVLVLLQFASYLGWEQVLQYWKARFEDRSSGDEALFTLLKLFSINFISGFIPLAFLLVAYLRNNPLIPSNKNYYWPVWVLVVTIFYNGVFFSWTAIHEFAWMAFGLFGTVFFAVYLFPYLPVKKLNDITVSVSLVSVAIYFIINPPGNKSFSGEHYDQQQQTAMWIKKNISSNIPIFINGKTDKVIEFYCKRTFTTVPTIQDASAAANEYGLGDVVFLDFENNHLKRATLVQAKRAGITGFLPKSKHFTVVPLP